MQMRSYRLKTMYPAVISLFLFGCCQPAFAAATEYNDIDLLNKTGDAIAQIAQSASPAVVSVRVEKTVAIQNPFGSGEFQDPFEQFFGKDFQKFFNEPGPGEHFFRFETPMPQSKQLVRGLGSGFIVDSTGYILTNNHVVSDSDKVIVKLAKGAEYTAKVVGTDVPTDLAVVKIDAGELPTLELGDSDKLKVGQWVIAIGNPFGLTSTVTVGVVSAKGREGIGIEDYEDFIQTDAAINMGNSGGPLLNARGKVIGINTAIVGGNSGGSIGIGFAIPSNMAKVVYQQLKEKGKVTRGYVGIVIQQLTPDLAKHFNITGEKGILISEVTKDSPAEKAGLKRGDVITKLNNKQVDDIAEFRNNIAMKMPGTKVELTVIRDGKEENVPVVIGKLSPETKLKASSAKPGVNIGLTVQNLTNELAAQLGYKGEKGVVITSVEPGSPADDAGLKTGMLIEQVNQQPVTNVDEFQAEIQKETKTGSVLLLIRYKNYTEYVIIKFK
jgi:serine protease Do